MEDGRPRSGPGSPTRMRTRVHRVAGPNGCLRAQRALCERAYARPAWQSHKLAVGCEDGGCSIFDLSDEGAAEPTMVHRTPPQGARLLCVSFSPQGSHLACAAADGSVRVWHVASWQALSRYVLESAGRRRPPLVWSVLLLSDLTVVSGDSTGRVSFYDGRHGTLVRSFASHQADVLALAASASETQVFASGVDQKARHRRHRAPPADPEECRVSD